MKVYVIWWIDSKDIICVVDSKDKALEWLHKGNGYYGYTELELNKEGIK